MPRRSLLITLVMCLAAALCCAAVASAASRGVLTKAEYHQLQVAQKRIKSLESSDTRSFTRVTEICAHMHQVSRLIVAVRSGCLALIRLGGDRGRLDAQATRCGINPGSEAALLTCMVPAVQRYYGDAEVFYRDESAVNRLAQARGFNRTCVAVIGDSQSNIAAEGRVAQDLRAAVTALQQQNPGALQTLFSQIDTEVKSIKPGPSLLALCPHR